jgi:hypothetical protein
MNYFPYLLMLAKETVQQARLMLRRESARASTLNDVSKQWRQGQVQNFAQDSPKPPESPYRTRTDTNKNKRKRANKLCQPNSHTSCLGVMSSSVGVWF